MAGIKKKTSLRDKSSKRTLSSKISAFKQEVGNEGGEEYHENPMLKLSKISKKEKQQTKSSNFVERLSNKVTFNTSNSISKSALRRRKRKSKEELKPKMNELLSSLPETTLITSLKLKSKSKHDQNESNIGFISKQTSNAPNANKRSGHKKILIEENKNFNNVLKNPEFKASPFSALKNAIQQNLQH
ncbi:ribosome biogenesis protein SLX9 [Scheffersomyces amazonensis]|uniref:ribosome biogenesis protein SLX9 n=1 Tax=Scheffersomyces amazonensis TaxID=1078765 RepID=UPI00315CD203